ncbi:FUSC family membrane protein [Flammeovirga kamogawensis]|uniref:FUSC family protein n=1 Tax=Flammeovirga kamogawensis TaxID=373891 RepID=A0ABX8GYT4_9BACT|nr:FUSC family membrane protein [Flammeovirga kamogawensis]MBB6458931.1 putative membrane protein YccC [Flammeovirga kamogawensis]QWG08507.1 FUSC family protein [Flammeovirga kamogawensis]TRX66800.1 hypothetical protein EO216_01155 [Flammeovirga kamogawensis]
MNKLLNFYKSIHLSNGLRMTISIVTPLTIGLLFGDIYAGTSVALGALCVGLSDSPGTWSEKAKGLIGGAFIYPLTAMGMAYMVNWPWVGAIFLTVISFAAALLSIFGNRSTLIGNSILISISLGISFGAPILELTENALWMLGGGLWYSMLSLVLWQIRPYASIEKVLGECYELMGQYLQFKAILFTNPSKKEIEKKVFSLQTKIDHKQEEVRNLLLRQRSALQGATPHGRSLILLMRISIDIFERASATHISYSDLHNSFKGTSLPKQLHDLFIDLGKNLDEIGIAIISRERIETLPIYKKSFDQLQFTFEELRDNKDRTIPISQFAEVKNIIRNFNRIDRYSREAASFTDWNNIKEKSYTDGLKLPSFITKSDQGTFADNLNLQSGHFRHAIRVCVAMLIGYLCSLFLGLDRGYWVWLSISVIMKPSFSITKQRMIARTIGTTLGIIIASALVFITKNAYLYLLFMLPLGIITFGTLTKNYRVGMTFLTPFILLIIATSTQFEINVSLYRVADTALGGLIAFAVSFLLFPEFEVKNIKSKLITAVRANCTYFSEVSIGYTGQQNVDPNNYRLARKAAQLANANLAMSFQNMLSDPKNKQLTTSDLYEFIAASRMIFAHTATLSANVERLSKKYKFPDLKPFIATAQAQFEYIIAGIEKSKITVKEISFNDLLSEFNQELELLELNREIEIRNGIKDSLLIKTLSDYVLITNQLKRLGKNINYLENCAAALVSNTK